METFKKSKSWCRPGHAVQSASVDHAKPASVCHRQLLAIKLWCFGEQIKDRFSGVRTVQLSLGISHKSKHTKGCKNEEDESLLLDSFEDLLVSGLHCRYRSKKYLFSNLLWDTGCLFIPLGICTMQHLPSLQLFYGCQVKAKYHLGKLCIGMQRSFLSWETDSAVF